MSEGTKKSTLAKFDALPVVPATNEECDAIGDFLRRADEVEKKELEKSKEVEGMSEAAIKTARAHHSYAEASSESEKAAETTNTQTAEEDIENPFASYYA